ncbi:MULTISPECIES: tryptophan synthase subunit beta like protein [Halomonadaceae]|uniref:tryptophan synthase subunit beta like protein n=1 Tax=Halomonas TaxID=2745 RepID=UPI0018A7582F|nr:tryptophan synthase subunit beta like protein [Halomonas sp. 328]MBF8221257.1 tryptophan synthase subunit beta like protein [Halomonas sp. 328]
MYVSRDETGALRRVSREATPECREWLPGDDPELDRFLGRETARDPMQASDLELVRVLEDLIQVLMEKGVISFTDLPDAARDKLLTRQSLRRRINSVNLLDDEEDGVI